MSAPDIAELPAEDAEEPDSPDTNPGVEADKQAREQLEQLDVGSGAEAVGDDSDEPDVAEVDLTEDDLGAGGSDLFAGDETSDSSSSSSSSSSDDSEDETPDDPLGLDAADDMDAIVGAINEGAARLAVVGLEDDEKDDLMGEFEETFAAFRLGHFGAQAADEYILSGEDEVDPVWGLLGTAMLCAAFALWTRPDSEEQIERMKDAVGGITDGVAA